VRPKLQTNSKANQKLLPADVENAKSDIASCGAVVAQLEVPIETIECAAKIANDLKVPFVLDPAPARELGPELLSMVDVLTPNETEAQILTGIEVTDEESARAAAGNLLGRGVKAVILTLGDKGFLLADSEQTKYVSSQKVEAVDSTAAGDAFTGSLGCVVRKLRSRPFCHQDGSTTLDAYARRGRELYEQVSGIQARITLRSSRKEGFKW